MQAVLYTHAGIESGKIELDSAFFGREVNTGLIHRLLVLQNANARNPIAHTKTRSERNGSTRKLYKQKGTGQARVGDSRSPTRRGGGIAFGPLSNRNFELRMNKKERRCALLSILSSKAAGMQVKVIESFSTDATKTKDMLKVFANMNLSSAVLAVLPTDTAVFQAGRNVPTVKVIGANYLNPHDLLKFKELVFTKESLEYIKSHFAN
ncbi:MAG: 50S ribosomal protein L4 [Candidatus Gracilibacteria bacterium]|nr:50S ribosomal protein L4 [Candidatus Gracilibacteria bacterium]